MSNETTVERPVDVTNVTGQAEQERTVEPQAADGDNGTITLFRHPTNKMLGGVCSGLADYLNWDPSLVRILWVVATVTTGGGGFLAYLALWLLLPVGTKADGQISSAAIELNERNLGVAAKVLIGLGVLWLLTNLGILPSLWATFWSVTAVVFWPLVLIGIGYLILRGSGKATEWRVNLSGWQERMRAPTRADVKNGLSNLRARLPLQRSRRNRLFMGVCGGIGQKLGVDPNLVRLVWVAFSIGSVGIGVLAYVLVGLLLPEEKPAELDFFDANAQDVQIIDGTATYKV